MFSSALVQMDPGQFSIIIECSDLKKKKKVRIFPEIYSVRKFILQYILLLLQLCISVHY